MGGGGNTLSYLLGMVILFCGAQMARAEWYGFKGRATSPSYWDVQGNWYITGGGTWNRFTSGAASNIHINKNAGGRNNPGFVSGWDNTVTFKSVESKLGNTLKFCAGTTASPIKFVATSPENGITSTSDLWVKDDTDNGYGTSYQTSAPCLEIQSGTYKFKYFRLGNKSGKTSTLVMTGGEMKTTGDYSRIGVGGGDGVFTIKGGSFDNLESSNKNITLGQDSGSSGTLNIQGGTFTAGGYVALNYNAGAKKSIVNLTGGTLEVNRIYLNNPGTSGGTITIDGGTLKANEDRTDFLPAHESLHVYVGDAGATFDTSGFNITIEEEIENKSGEIGSVRFMGGGTVTLRNMPSYTGKTLVAAGTRIETTRAIAEKIISKGLELSGIPEIDAPYTILSSDEDLSGLNLSNVSCGLDAIYNVDLSDDKKSVVITCTGIPALYIGPCDGSLSEGENWSSGVVPTSGNAYIYCESPANLVMRDAFSFSPSSITFIHESASIAISGDGKIVDVTSITNLSSASHTINVPVYFKGNIQVKQEAMADRGDLIKAHITFAGGAHAALGCTIENDDLDAVHSRCMFGKYYLYPSKDNPWSVTFYGETKRLCLAENSELHVPYVGKLTELYVGAGAKTFIGDMVLDGRLMYQMATGGEMIVTNSLTAVGDTDRYVSWNQGTSVPGVFKFESITNSITSDKSLWLADGNATSKHVFYIGAGGLNFLNAHNQACYKIGRGTAAGNIETIRPWDSDFTIARSDLRTAGANDWDVVFYATVDFCTSDVNGIGRTITLDALTRAADGVAITVSGNGMLRVNKTAKNYRQPTVTVKDTATLAYAPDASLGASMTTVQADATLQVAESGTVELGGNLTLKNNACLGFNWTDRIAPMLNLSGKTVTFDTGATVVVKISAVKGKRARGGHNVLTSSGGAFEGVNVALADGAPEWTRGIIVENGEIVLKASYGTYITIR